MFSFFNTQGKQIFTGNILFVVCCAFYLAWWLLAFNPSGAFNDIKTGWLLVPASIAGLLGVVLIIRGILAEKPASQLLNGGYILWGGIAVYFVLLIVTIVLFKRPVTTELILIVGWAMLALAEINTLFGIGLFSHRVSLGFVLLICTAFVISLICYIIYYRLDSRAGYIDGMIPLLLSGLTMLVISGFIVILVKWRL